MDGAAISTQPRRTEPRPASRSSATGAGAGRRATPAKKATTARKAVPAKKTTARKAAPARKPSPAREAAAARTAAPAPAARATRPPVRRPQDQAYRPPYWIVVVMAIALVGLAFAVLISVSVLWTLAGPFTTTMMVLAYGAVMFVLWKVGVSRL